MILLEERLFDIVCVNIRNHRLVAWILLAAYVVVFIIKLLMRLKASEGLLAHLECCLFFVSLVV